MDAVAAHPAGHLAVADIEPVVVIVFGRVGSNVLAQVSHFGVGLVDHVNVPAAHGSAGADVDPIQSGDRQVAQVFQHRRGGGHGGSAGHRGRGSVHGVVFRVAQHAGVSAVQPANLVAIGHLIPGNLVLGAQAGGLGGGKAHHAAQRHLADGCRRGAGVLADIHLIRRGHDIIAVAGPRGSGAGRGGSHLAGLLEFLQLPLGQLEHAVAAQVAPQAVRGLHGIPVVAVPDHRADLGQHRALLLDLAHDVAVGIGRGAEPYAGHLRGHITDVGAGAGGGQRGREGVALRVADLSHRSQDEAERAPFGPEHFIPGFQRCAALGRHVKVRQHGILCQLGDGIPAGGGAQIHTALEQLDIALAAAGNEGIGRGCHDHRGRLGRRGNDIALRVAVAEAVVADITGDVVFLDLHPDETVDHSGGAVVVGQHLACGQFGFIRLGEDLSVGCFADIDLVLDQLHIALHARGQDGRGGRGGHHCAVGQLIIGQLIRIEHPHGSGGQIAHCIIVFDKIPIVGREACGLGQNCYHSVQTKHVHCGAAGRLTHIHAVHQHQAVVGIPLGSGGRRRGGQAGRHIPGSGGRRHGGADQDKIVAVDVSGIRAVGILGRAALDLVPGGLALGLHIQHRHGPAIGQSGPEVTRGGHVLAEEHVVLRNHAQRLPGDERWRGIGCCHGSRSGGDHRRRNRSALIRIRCNGRGGNIAGLTDAPIRTLLDISGGAAVSDIQPFVGVHRGKGHNLIAGQHHVLRNRHARFIDTAGFPIERNAVLNRHHIKLHGSACRYGGIGKRRNRALGLGHEGGIAEEITAPALEIRGFRGCHELNEILFDKTGFVFHRIAVVHANVRLHVIPHGTADILEAQDFHHPILGQACQRIVGVVIGIRVFAEIDHAIR